MEKRICARGTEQDIFPHTGSSREFASHGGDIDRSVTEMIEKKLQTKEEAKETVKEIYGIIASTLHRMKQFRNQVFWESAPPKT